MWTDKEWSFLRYVFHDHYNLDLFKATVKIHLLDRRHISLHRHSIPSGVTVVKGMIIEEISVSFKSVTKD